MKKIYLFAAMAAMLAACSENDLSKENAVQQKTQENAVTFDSYVNRSTTRSGANGTMAYGTGSYRLLTNTGFGVFGYYTDNNDYNALTIPNFFYNQKVTYNSSGATKYWTYDPIKYWPNEYGNSAIADDNDKVSYFAYAPYVNVVPSNGKPAEQTYGITQLSHNAATGDPYVKYIASFDWKKAVDLLWGVIPSTNTSWNTVSGQTQTLEAGMPWLNVERPLEAVSQGTIGDNQRVKFNFMHALSKLNVQVDYDADAINHNVANLLDYSQTRVYIRSVSFTGFSMKGALNLNNVEPNIPLWMAFDATNDLEAGEVTVVNDGRKDGKEGVGGAVALNESNRFINPALIQESAWAGDNKGVREKAQNLFAFPASDKVAADMKIAEPTKKIDINGLSDFEEAVGIAPTNGWDYTTTANAAALLSWPVMVIPNGEEITVTIVYDVETVDKNLATLLSDGTTKGSSIENRISKTITFSGADRNYMEAGKKYTINLHLGLNSVKFDAAVEDWDAGATGEAWLPDNIVSYQAPGIYNYDVTAGATANAAFKLTGFAPNETISDAVSTPVTGDNTYTSDAAGNISVAASKYTLTPNNTVLNVTTANAITFTGDVSGKQTILNLIQAAAQPTYDGTSNSTLSITTDTKVGTFVLKAGTTAINGDFWNGSTRNVTIVSAYRNGLPMTEVDENDTPTGALQFNCDKTTNRTINLGTKATAGEVFIFTIKAGDAGEVTIKCTIATT